MTVCETSNVGLHEEEGQCRAGPEPFCQQSQSKVSKRTTFYMLTHKLVFILTGSPVTSLIPFLQFGRLFSPKHQKAYGKGRQSTHMIFFGVVWQSGKSASASELGAPHDNRRRGWLGHEQVSWVSRTHLWKQCNNSLSNVATISILGKTTDLTDLMVSVDGGEFPQRVWQSHSAVISLEVQEVPFPLPLMLINVRLKGEAIQLRVTLCKA